MTPETEKPIQTCSIKEAKKILHDNVFGPDEWKKFFGRDAQVANIPEIPWGKYQIGDSNKSPILFSKPLPQTRFLFLGLDTLGGEPLNLLTWQKLMIGKKGPSLKLTNNLTDDFAKKTCKPCWYMIRTNIIQFNQAYMQKLSGNASTALRHGSFDDLPENIKSSLPSATEVITANILYSLLNKKFISPYDFVYTSDLSNPGEVRIGLSEAFKKKPPQHVIVSCGPFKHDLNGKIYILEESNQIPTGILSLWLI